MTCNHCDNQFEKDFVDGLVAQVKETFQEGVNDEWCRSFIRATLTDALRHYNQVPVYEEDINR